MSKFKIRKLGDQTPAKCDVCGCEVGDSDYLFLCRGCRDKLPECFKKTHYILVYHKAARKQILTDAINNKDFYNEHIEISSANNGRKANQ